MRENKDKAPVVSVVVLTYNHEKYIRQCLDSMLRQKTDFPCEILIHDDKSTDGTCGILKEYGKNYPDIIHVFYEKENRYSRRQYDMFSIMFPFVRGKYISLCEGDDYFSDENKLQHQYEAMENNPQCRFCVHRVASVSEEGKSLGTSIPKRYSSSTEIPSEEFLSTVKDYEFQTSGYFFRTEDALRLVDPAPDFVKCSDTSDECYMLYFGSLGPVFYLEETLTDYRTGSQGSWTLRTTGERLVRHYQCQIAMIEAYNIFTEGRFEKICREYRELREKQIAQIERDRKTQSNDLRYRNIK